MNGRGPGRGAGYLVAGAGLAGVVAGGYLGLVTGALGLDLGVGRRTRPLGPQTVQIAAPRQLVFDLIAQPYLGRTTRAMQDKVQVLERGSDMVLATHRTPVRSPLPGRRLVAVTVETVRFRPPERIDFRLVRGPVPYVVETFTLTEDPGHPGGTRLTYTGEIGADLWRAGQWWAGVVAGPWQATVATSLTAVKAEAEHRAGQRTRPTRQTPDRHP
jgi:hypothetical protein